MNKILGLILGIIAIIIIGGAFMSINKNDASDTLALKTTDTQVVMEKTSVTNSGDVAVMKNETEVKSGDSMMVKNEAVDTGDAMMRVGTYESYSPSKIAQANASRNVVLFFKASWCPTCRVADADIKANLSKIPANLVILDVDYDASSDLKRKYGVTYQHTFVQVDASGNMIKKWSGSSSLDAIVAQVK